MASGDVGVAGFRSWLRQWDDSPKLVEFFSPLICTSALGKRQNCAADKICFIPEERNDGRGGDRHVNSLHRGSKGTGLVTFFFFFT